MKVKAIEREGKKKKENDEDGRGSKEVLGVKRKKKRTEKG